MLENILIIAFIVGLFILGLALTVALQSDEEKAVALAEIRSRQRQHYLRSVAYSVSRGEWYWKAKPHGANSAAKWAQEYPEIAAEIKAYADDRHVELINYAAMREDRAAALRNYATNEALRADVRAGRVTINF